MQIDEMENREILFGVDKRKCIVAVEPAGQFMRLFFRDGSGVHFHDEPFSPFILVKDPALVADCRVPCAVDSLEGEGEFRFRLKFDSWGECIKAREHLAARYGSGSGKPFLFLSDLSHQYLLSTGTTLFKGMAFEDLRTLTLDIETYCAPGFAFSNAERPDDRIISIACRDSCGEETVLRGDLLDESQMLMELNRLISASDPDVIVGHNIFRFDLEYIRKRAVLHRIRLGWGRNGSEPHVTANSRWSIAEKAFDFPRWDIYGRHIIDTYFLVQHYDISQRSLESHGLKQVARHFGLAAADRVYLEGDKLTEQFRSNPELIYRYNLDDVRETEALYRLLAYPWFLQTRIFPYSFQNCPLRGNATRINALFLREYLRRHYAIPAAGDETPVFEGGYTELFRQGIVGPVLHCDVASLYPSLMIAYQLRPQADRAGLFLPMLSELRSFRLRAKLAEAESTTDAEKSYYGALQQVFKILINSFYGYLGTSIHNFSDPAVAAEVTRLGRVTIRSMLDFLVRERGEPIEVDTDGIYFRPPPGCDSEAEQRELIRSMSDGLPAGIEVELDGRYSSMLAYKSKNYALLGDDGSITIKGSSLKSRGMEPFLREFLREGIRLLLTSSPAAVERLYGQYVERLTKRRFEIGWLARTETLRESPAAYRSKLQAGKRNRSAAFELALASGRQYRAGDQISYYISGSGRDVVAYEHCRETAKFDPSRPDVNIPYYLEKLRLLKKRFDPFLPAEPSLFD